MNRRELLHAAALAPLAILSPPAALGSAPTDVMQRFWTVYESTRRDAGRTAALLREFFGPEAALYQGAGIKIDGSRVAKWLSEFDAIEPDVRRLSKTFARSYRTHARHFTQHFPDFAASDAPIYVMPSLFSFDGHLQPWNGRLPLFVGLDGIVKYHGPHADLSVFLDHETFHLYQYQVNPSLNADGHTPLFVTLWVEGTATYVSELLNPHSSLLHILLDDRPLSAASEGTIDAAAAEIFQRLESTDDGDANRFFGAGHAGAEPARSGYRVGLNIARRVGATLTPAAMARLSPAQLRPLLARELQHMIQH